MNAFQLKKFRNQYHKQSEHIFSFDFRKTPPELRRMVSDVEFQVFLNLPYSRTDEGQILVNESAPEWNLLKDFLVALDRLPDSLLLDLYKVETKRGTGGLDDMEDCPDDEKARRIIFELLPEVIWAHRVNV